MKFKKLYEVIKVLSAEELADMHDVSVEQINKQIKIGIEVEKEHTDSDEEAEKIAKQHIYEDPEYYTKLKEVGL